MSKKVNKITEDELARVKANQDALQKHLSHIGFLEVQKGNDLGAIAQLEKEMGEIKASLEETYGAININIQTGEYTDIPEEEIEKLKKV